MFLNETLVLLTYTANMMASLPNETNTQNISKINVVGNDNSDLKNNYSTTTLSPEEEENKFNLEDGKCVCVFLCVCIFVKMA